MRHAIYLSTVAWLLFAANVSFSEQPEPKFESVFNGVDLTGWSGATDDYEIVDGAITCKEGGGGVLFTNERYANFTVSLEFKLPPGGNNGLAIRYPGEGRASYDGMCELQVLDDDADKYKELDPRQYHGSIYGMVPAKRGHLKPTGQWNQQVVTVEGSKIRVVLNGHEIVNADVSQVDRFKDDNEHPGLALTEGHFGFAGHNDPVMFRNIKIARLSSPASYTATNDQRTALAKKVLFHVPFDEHADADRFVIDGRAHTSSDLSRSNVTPGLQIPMVEIEKGAGKFRDAIRFSAKTDPVLVYLGSESGYREKNWNGAFAFWMRSNPDRDLEPGYCDPIQITEKGWNDGAFFLDFDKDLPRDFRLGVFPDYAFWNPQDTQWDDIAVADRPMVVVNKPPFSDDRWTHVCFTWQDVNAVDSEGKPKDGTSKLYLNGEFVGERVAPLKFTWDQDKAIIMVGIYFIGWIDDMAIFSDSLTAEEVKMLYEYPMGIRYLR